MRGQRVYRPAKLDGEQRKRDLEQLQNPDEHVLVVHDVDGQHAQLQDAPIQRRQLGLHRRAQLPSGLLWVGGGDLAGQTEASQRGGGDVAGQAAALGRGARIRSHLGQHIGPALAGGQLEIEQVGDELDNEPVPARQRVGQLFRRVVDAGHR